MHPLLPAVAKRGERIGRFARLGDEHCKVALCQRHLAVAEFRGDIDINRKARITLEPVFADHSGIIGRAACRNGKPINFGKIEWQSLAAANLAGAEIGVIRQRMGNDLRLFVDFLLHEVAMVALVDHQRGAN